MNDPSREFEDIYNRMGQLMNLALGDFSLVEAAHMPWSPLADLRETDDAYQINVELPGVQRDQIDIQVQDRERTYLPSDVTTDQVSATLNDGVLMVTAPKSEAAKPQHIGVKA